jgi:hypothetical protein
MRRVATIIAAALPRIKPWITVSSFAPGPPPGPPPLKPGPLASCCVRVCFLRCASASGRPRLTAAGSESITVTVVTVTVTVTVTGSRLLVSLGSAADSESSESLDRAA